MADFDLAIVGGGINGAGIARDAAGRGLRVLLVEQNDLASGTSSASTKLIHGGLRYLEHGWFRLVREALTEREVLLRMAPHLIRPMRFVLPLEPGLRAPWLLRLGLFIYDHLGGRKLLPPTRTIDSCRRSARRAAQARYRTRLRIFRLLGRRCAAGGAQCARCRRSRRRSSARARAACAPSAAPSGGWCSRRGAGATSRPRASWSTRPGPWVGIFGENVLRQPPPPAAPRQGQPHRGAPPVRRTTAATSSRTATAACVFALPFERDFTLVGTTDRASPATRRRCADRGRDRLSLRRRERTLPQRHRAGRRGLGVRRRARAL